jgi:hypothetical protein
MGIACGKPRRTCERQSFADSRSYANARFALYQLSSFCQALFCRREGSPRPTRREFQEVPGTGMQHPPAGRFPRSVPTRGRQLYVSILQHTRHTAFPQDTARAACRKGRIHRLAPGATLLSQACLCIFMEIFIITPPAKCPHHESGPRSRLSWYGTCRPIPAKAVCLSSLLRQAP